MTSNSNECPICKGVGWLSQELAITDPMFGKMYRCSCQAEKDKEQYRLNCGLTESQRNQPMPVFKNTGGGTRKMIEAGKTFVKDPVGTLFIHGNNGVGKTTLAYAMVNRLVDLGYQTVYVTGPNMLAYIRDGYSEKVKDESAMRRLDRLQSVRVLIIDELDKVRPTEWVDEILSMFFDNRYRRKDELGTVVIANDPVNIRHDIVSRLMEGTVIKNSDTDYRMVN